MLNRRTLRIKIMQSLFAFEQCKEANYELALDQIEAHFEPDLNSMEVQDRELLKGRRKTARQLLEKKFANPKTPDVPDEVINEAVKLSLSAYHKQVKKDQLFFSKNMVLEVEKINELYYSVLGLFPAFAEVGLADKKSDFRNFIHSHWVEAVSAHAELKKLLLKSAFGWQGKSDQVRTWFRRGVQEV
jgi:N utilization substance protein B